LALATNDGQEDRTMTAIAMKADPNLARTASVPGAAALVLAGFTLARVVDSGGGRRVFYLEGPDAQKALTRYFTLKGTIDDTPVTG
jgi:hypothetical protein